MNESKGLLLKEVYCHQKVWLIIMLQNYKAATYHSVDVSNTNIVAIRFGKSKFGMILAALKLIGVKNLDT